MVTAQDPRFQNQVELAVRFGKTLFITEVDTVDPMLYSLVRKDLTNQGPRQTVTIGDKQVDYNEKFRLFFSTRNPHVRFSHALSMFGLGACHHMPHRPLAIIVGLLICWFVCFCLCGFFQPVLPPSASSIIAEVNFAVTRSGLEGQLLGVTLQFEQPELEKQKSEQLRQEEEVRVVLCCAPLCYVVLCGIVPWSWCASYCRSDRHCLYRLNVSVLHSSKSNSLA